MPMSGTAKGPMPLSRQNESPDACAGPASVRKSIDAVNNSYLFMGEELINLAP